MRCVRCSSVEVRAVGVIALVVVMCVPPVHMQFGGTFSTTFQGGAVASAGGVTAVAILPQLNGFGIPPFGGMQNPYYNQPQVNFNNPYPPGWNGGAWMMPSQQWPQQQQQQRPLQQQQQQQQRPLQQQQQRPQQQQQQRPQQQQQQQRPPQQQPRPQQPQQQQQYRPQQPQQQLRPQQQPQPRPQQPQQQQQQRPQQQQQQQPRPQQPRPQQSQPQQQPRPQPQQPPVNPTQQMPSKPIAVITTTARPTVSPDLIANIFSTTPQPAQAGTPRPTISPDVIANIFNPTPPPPANPPPSLSNNMNLITQTVDQPFVISPNPPLTSPANTPRPTISPDVIANIFNQTPSTPLTHQPVKRENYDFVYPDSPLYGQLPVTDLMYGAGIQPRRK